MAETGGRASFRPRSRYHARRVQRVRVAPAGGLAMRRTSWWIVGAVVALAAAVVWFGGSWLLRQFIRLHGGE